MTDSIPPAVARCVVTELYVPECDHCKQIIAKKRLLDGLDSLGDPFGVAPEQSYDFTDTNPKFRARYRGTCTACGYEIESDMYIRSDGEGGYAHEECLD